MRSSLLVAFVFAGCGFSTSVNPTSDGNTVPNDGKIVDTPDGYIADAQQCFGSGIGMTCLPVLPQQPRQLSMTSNFDTGNSGNCTHVMMVAGVESCVLTGTTITLGSGTFRAVGSRPLVLIARESITISGSVSVSSLRGGGAGAASPSSACVAPSTADDDSGGGGGGGGGSFAGRGGNGGNGDLNNSGLPAGTSTGSVASAAITGAVTTLRAGCPGIIGGDGVSNGGSAGAGGGVMYLIAGTSITIGGGVFAVGGGGTGGINQSGGGGGGSGGMIGLDAPSIVVTGAVIANGGGGGEGAGNSTVGGNGFDGLTSGARAPGGSGGDSGGGNGGDSSGGGVAIGEIGENQDGGGGGGGGGAGYIYVKGALSGGGAISPSASVF